VQTKKDMTNIEEIWVKLSVDSNYIISNTGVIKIVPRVVNGRNKIPKVYRRENPLKPRLIGKRLVIGIGSKEKKKNFLLISLCLHPLSDLYQKGFL
jgi:hypothetical protein